jgi:hypothetical protein
MRVRVDCDTAAHIVIRDVTASHRDHLQFTSEELKQTALWH